MKTLLPLDEYGLIKQALKDVKKYRLQAEKNLIYASKTKSLDTIDIFISQVESVNLLINKLENRKSILERERKLQK